jgi:hypothetical protein
MSESEPPQSEPAKSRIILIAGDDRPPEYSQSQAAAPVISFNQRELGVIFNLYAARVAAGEWRDYALDFTPSKAVFSIFRRSCETPLFRIEKNPSLARRQGAYSVIDGGGLVLRRGQDLARVLGVLDRKLRLVCAE